MLIRFGYEITIESQGPLPLIVMMSPRPERMRDMRSSVDFRVLPDVVVTPYLDSFGNRCHRMVAPGGAFTMRSDGVIADSGLHDPVDRDAPQHRIEDLPADVLVYLLPSRYCDTDLLMQEAWSRFGHINGGWARVQAVVDWVHQHITFDYQKADATRTARDGFEQGVGVCRDYAHLAITLCRCLNIPARYVNGHLGDIGVPPAAHPMDFSAWMEVYLGGRWWTFDPRNLKPRIGRIVLAYGRDAADVPMIHSFGPHRLIKFDVWTDDVTDDPAHNGAGA